MGPSSKSPKERSILLPSRSRAAPRGSSTSTVTIVRYCRRAHGAHGTIHGVSMSEHIAQMAPMLIVAGLAAGWVSEALARAGGYGLIWNMALGIGGSAVLGAAVWLFAEPGMLSMVLIGLSGAALGIFTQRKLWRSMRPST